MDLENAHSPLSDLEKVLGACGQTVIITVKLMMASEEEESQVFIPSSWYRLRNLRSMLVSSSETPTPKFPSFGSTMMVHPHSATLLSEDNLKSIS